MLNHTAKKELSLAPSGLPQAPLAHSRPTDRGNATKSSESLVAIRKRKHPSPSNTDDDSKPSRKRKHVTVIASQPGGDLGSRSAHSHHMPNREDSPSDTPPRPPIEQIEMWVPTPTAKFGPPKRKHAAPRPRDPPKERRTDSIVSTVTSVPSQAPLTVSKQPVGLSESQIIALRQEEEESQSQPHLPVARRSPKLGSPGHSSDPLKSLTEDATGEAGENSQEVQDNHPTNQLSTDNQTIDRNADTAHISTLRSKACTVQDCATNPPVQRSVNPPHPAIPGPTRKSLVNPEVPTVIASTKSPLPEKQDPPHAKSTPSSVDQLSIRKPLWLVPRSGSFAERRALEARARLDLVRRGATHPTGNLVGGQSSTSIVPQIATQPLPHVVLQQVLSHLEARLRPVTENPTIPGVPPSEANEAGPSAVKTKEDMVTQDKSDRLVNLGAANVSPHDNEVITILPCDSSVPDTSPTAKSAG